ncbi:MAG TPA: AAA family ATPase [Solirubrobacteraceae bacterium]|nr:AAA family ATPase [Solirubrobacteraceae bacterium]
MRDDELRERLRDCNPWWRAAVTGIDPLAWVRSDHLLRARAAYDLGYRSGLLDDIACEPLDDKLIVLRGARRVGKSVLLKDTAARICERQDVDPRQLIYVPTDGMSAAGLRRAAKLGRDLTRSIGDAPRLWLFDEVTGVAGWTQALKYLRDNTSVGSDTVVCTGSSWDRDANLERDLLAGRAGTSMIRRSRILHPMSFREVLAVTGRDVPLPAVMRPWALQDEGARLALDRLELFVDELDLAWQAYLTSGGFPRAVAEHHRSGEVSEAFLRDLTAWLHRDVDPAAGEDSVPKLLSELERRCSSPLNRRSLAEDLGYGSRQSADARLARLVRVYAAIWCHKVDDTARRVAGAQSKLYLCDPLLAWIAPRLRAGVSQPDFSRLTEASVGVALARAIDEIEPGRWDDGDCIGYLRTGKGNEIDFAPVALASPAGVTRTPPIESKWVVSGWRAEAKVIEGRFSAGLVATRGVLDSSHSAWALPAPALALLLG